MDNKTSNPSSGRRSPSDNKGRSGGKFFSGGPEPEQARTLAQKFLNFFGFGKPPKKEEKPSGKSGGTKRKIQKHPVSSGRLFIGNLSYSVKEKDLKEFFEQIGEVVSAEVVTNRQTRRSKGFGFVTMASISEAEKAVSDLDGKTLNDREISVSGAKSDGKKEQRSPKGDPPSRSRQESGKRSPKPRRENRERSEGRRDRGERSRGSDRRKGNKGSQSSSVVAMPVEEITSTSLSMTNLASDFGENELEHLFAGVAKVSKSEISEGSATIEMASIEDAQTAVRLLDGKDFMGQTLSLSGEAPTQ